MKNSQILLYLFLLSSCISPYEITSAYNPSIVIEGMITDQPGPYVVKVHTTMPVADQTINPIPVKDAIVVIHDDLGESEKLYEGSPGNYYTTMFQGVIGRSYWITIDTKEGGSYQSATEKLQPVGDMSPLRAEFVQNEDPNSNRQVSSKNGFNVFLNSKVLSEQEGRVLWRWTGTFEIATLPQLITRPVPGGMPVPNPAPCSGYVAQGKTIRQFDVCSCCNCWITQYNSDPIISDPSFISNGEINDFKLAFVESNVRFLYNKYILKVEQLSLSEPIYIFWKGVKQGRQNSSNLFQIPPSRVTGNIKTLNSKSLPVVGYFGASSIKTQTIELNRDEVPYGMQDIDSLILDCRKAYKYSTNVKPHFW